MDLTAGSDAEVSQNSGAETFFSPSTSTLSQRPSVKQEDKTEESAMSSEEIVISVDSR